ncbi:MAG: arsenic efflux protein [Oscillospiraceae bacterium]|nr:arsenic efflux protein [Oscillospiraceae bacterium]
MLHILMHCAEHALIDSLIGLPILFFAYLLMELLERSRKLNEELLHSYSRKAGPAVGGILGVIPQCGISGAAATLFSTGAISLGTMLAVFFATSDEMLPILIANIGSRNSAVSVSGGLIAGIVAAKAGAGIVLGYLADALFGKAFARGKDIHSFCEREHCDCDDEGTVFLSALRHTVRIFLMLLAVNFALDLVLELIGIDRLGGSMLSKPVIGEILLALIGLIPNCSISVIMTEAYLFNIIDLGGLFAGLLSNAGIGLLVLFRTNRSLKENLAVMALLFVFGALSGMLIGLVF